MDEAGRGDRQEDHYDGHRDPFQEIQVSTSFEESIGLTNAPQWREWLGQFDHTIEDEI
jgi:hypothetical protein